jgi:small-conductance mechanosensitive channel
MIKNILEFKLIDLEKFELSVSDLLGVVIILITARFLLFVIRIAMRRFLSPSPGSPHNNRKAIYNFIKYFVYTIAIVMSLDTAGIKITFFLAGSAALFVGLGFGLQDAFKDMVSGILMLIERNVNIGDIIEADDGTIGQVVEINIRTSKVRTRDGIMIIIPNHKFINDSVINWTSNNALTRFNLSVGVAYGSDVKLVTKILKDCAIKHIHVKKEPEPTVRFADFGDSSLDFELLFWTDKSWTIESLKSDIRYEIDAEFRKNNVTIPFPQRDIHHHNKPN